MTLPHLKAVIIIVSDTASANPASDACAPLLRHLITSVQDGKVWEIAATHILPDDVEAIQNYVKGWTDGEEFANLIVTSGGTGFAGRDVTPEAIEPLLEKKAGGLVHAMLAASLEITSFGMMSRPVAGVRKKTVIVTLPGKPQAAKENLEAILKQLMHACQQAGGADSRALHAGGLPKLEKEAGIKQSSDASGSRQQHSNHHHHHHHGHGHAGPRAHTNPDDRISNDPAAGPSNRYRKSPYPMKTVEEALDLIEEHSLKPETERTKVDESLIGYILAEDVAAAEAVPAFRASIVDGYAIRIPSSGAFDKGIYPVAFVSLAQAGDVQELAEGEIARITTGAPLPPGSSSVVMVEDTLVKSTTEDGTEEASVEILTSEIREGENVREIGSDVEKGSIILKQGDGISASGGEVGLLASVGVQEVLVYRKPVIGVLSTGDEIIEHSSIAPGALKLGQVRDTNRPTLLTAIRASGFEGIDLGIASDKPGALETALRDALRRVDVLITTGGVSMGEKDLLKSTIERQLGGEIHFGRVAMKPGKPTTFATLSIKANDGEDVSRVIFALPGNPASAVVTFHLFVLPSLHYASNVTPAGLPQVKVKLEQDLRPDPARREYQRVGIVVGSDGALSARSTGGQRSSRIGSFKGANGLVCLPAVEGIVKKGEMVDALLLGGLG